MAQILYILLGALLFISQAQAGTLGLLGAGPGAPGAAVAYAGPGDINTTSGVAWGGFRAYSAATAGTKAIRLIRASDSTQQDINTLATGALDEASASTFCNATTCKVVTIYDKIGTACSGACDFTQATDALRPTFTQNAIGSNSCASFVRSTNLRLVSAALGATTSQPFTQILMAERTGSTTSSSNILITGTSVTGIFFVNSANLISGFAGSSANVAANDNAFHAFQVMYNAASSKYDIDGSTSTVSLGTNTMSSTLALGNGPTGGSGTDGIGCEFGFWSGDQSGNFASMNTNIHTYWGF